MIDSGEIHRRASSTRKAQMQHLGKLITQNQKVEKKVEQRTKQREEQLTTQILTDSLTGIWNRRALLGDGDSSEIINGNFVPHLTREIAEARKGENRNRSSMPLSVLLLDIDFFKTVNDTFGHVAGDAVLQSLTKLLVEKIRKSDILGRLGGEEFLVILPETDRMGAIKEAERLRQLVANNTFDGKAKNITISIGAAELKDKHKKPANLVHEADLELYKAKGAGRNKVFPKPNATSLKI